MQRVPFGNGVKDQNPAAPTYLLLNSARKIAAFHSINVHKPNGEPCPVGKNIWNIGFLGRENGILSIQGFGEEHTGQSIGLLHLTPWEATVVAADVAMKSGNVELGFLDRFSGAVILLGSRAEVKSALEHVVEFFRTELGFTVCELTER